MIFHQHFHCFNSKHSPNTCVISQHTIPIAPKTFGRCHNFCWFQVAGGKTTSWPKLEITGTIKNLSPALWRLQHLTALYLNDNSLFRIPPSISLLQVSFYSTTFFEDNSYKISKTSLLQNLKRLDLSNNKLRSLPAEIGDLHRFPKLISS